MPEWITLVANAEEVRLMGEVRDEIDGAIDQIEGALDAPNLSEDVVRYLGGAIGSLRTVLMQIDDATGMKYTK